MKFRAFLIISMLFVAPGLEAGGLFGHSSKKDDTIISAGAVALLGGFALVGSWMLFKELRWEWILSKSEQELYDDALKVYTDITRDFEIELKLVEGLSDASDFDYLMRCRRIELVIGGKYSERVRYPLNKFVEDVEKKIKELDWEVQILEAKFNQYKLDRRGLRDNAAQLLVDIQTLKTHLTLLKNTIRATSSYKLECAESIIAYEAFSAGLRDLSNIHR